MDYGFNSPNSSTSANTVGSYLPSAPSYPYITPSYPYLTPSYPYLTPSYPYLTPSYPYLMPSYPYLTPSYPYLTPSYPYLTPSYPYLTPSYPYLTPSYPIIISRLPILISRLPILISRHLHPDKNGTSMVSSPLSGMDEFDNLNTYISTFDPESLITDFDASPRSVELSTPDNTPLQSPLTSENACSPLLLNADPISPIEAPISSSMSPQYVHIQPSPKPLVRL